MSALSPRGLRSPEMTNHLCGEHLDVSFRQIVRHNAELQHADEDVEPRVLAHAGDALAHCSRATHHHRAARGELLMVWFDARVPSAFRIAMVRFIEGSSM